MDNASIHGNNEFLSERIYITSKALSGVNFRANNIESFENLEKNSIDFRTFRKWGSAKKYKPTRAKTRVLKMQIMANQNLPQGILLKRRHLSSHRVNWQFEIQT